jgi:3-oxoacyl-[acyl-carrier protein] reductase
MSRRWALVTGAAQGIGAATAEALALRRGDHVVLTDIQHALGAETAARIGRRGGSAQYLPMDVRSTESVENAFAILDREHPAGFDLIVNNAGYVSPRPLDALTDEAWSDVVNGNLTSMLRVVRAAAPPMRRARAGAIICMASIAGHAIGWGGRLAYSASKAGIAGFVRSLAVELGPDNIRVNGIAPGGLHSRAEDVPLGRVGTPEDVANAVLLLAGAEASFITGQVLTVDGGLTLQLGLSGSSR